MISHHVPVNTVRKGTERKAIHVKIWSTISDASEKLQHSRHKTYNGISNVTLALFKKGFHIQLSIN